MTQAERVTGNRSAGWYADPITVGAARYWDGRVWTNLVAWGGATRRDPTPLREVQRRAEAADAAIVSAYLADAARHGVVSQRTADALRLDIEQRVIGDAATEPTPATVAPTPTSEATPGPATPPSTAEPASLVTLPPPAAATRSEASPASASPTPVRSPLSAPPRELALPREPGRFARWWDDAGDAVRSDLALHGLAYLGVLMLFAGVTGLIAFSFGEVAPWVRSLAELLVPSALFVSAWYLTRRGASVVATSLTLVGGAITPIVVSASLTDGAPLPPDVTGRALPIAQGLAVAAVATVMMIVVRRAPANPLRFLAGPTLWMAAGLTAGVARDPIPTGYEAAQPDSLQLTAILAAVTLSLAWCSRRRVPGVLTEALRVVALPAAGVVYVIELILAGNEGWPLTSTLVAGIAMLLLLELLSDRFRNQMISGLQFTVVVVAAARLLAPAEPAWVAAGAAISLLALVEYVGWRRPAKPAEIVGLVLVGGWLLPALSESASAATAFGVVTAWGLWRHTRPADWLPAHDNAGVVAAFAATITTAALWDLGDTEPALVMTAGGVLLIAIAGRLWRPIADDLLWRWFVPAAALAVVAVSAGLRWGDAPVAVAAAAAMSMIAIILTTLPIGARVWLAAGTLLWSLANVAEALDLGRQTQAVVLASMALALLLGSLVVARPVCAHLATVGHVVGLGALAVPIWPGWDATVVVATVTLGFVATTLIDERREAVHLAALRRSQILASGPAENTPSDLAASTGAADVMPFLSLAGVWATAVLAVDAADWIVLGDPWQATISAGIAVVAAVVVRSARWRRARRRVLEWPVLVLAASAAVAAVAAVGSDRGHWSPVVSIALALAVVAATTAPRPLPFVWAGWFGVGALAVVLADRLGLDRDWTDVAVAASGAAAMVGGLVVQRRRHGPIPAGSFVVDRLLLPPVVLGAAAFGIGGTLGLAEGTDTEIGWTAAGMSLVVLAVAVLMPLGALAALAQALATGAYVLLAPWEPFDRPWTFAPWALLLLGAAWATRRPGEWSTARWDVPSFLVAHGVAALALVAAADRGELAITYALFGGISVGIAVVLRRWPWAAAGAVLVLVAGADAGSGWLALVLLLEGVALTVIGLQRMHEERWALLALGAASLIGAWFQLAEWQSWSTSTVYYATVPGAAAVALAAASGLRGGRRVRVPLELAGVWTAAGGVVSIVIGLAGVDDVGRRPGGLVFAGSLFVLAAAVGVTAVMVGASMRWAAAGLAAVAWAPAAWAVEVSATVATLVGTGVGLVGIGVVLAVDGFRPSWVWLRPAALFTGATQLGAAGAAISALPDTDLLVVVLLAVAIEFVAVGVLTDRPEFYVLSPTPALAAWLLYARDSLAGDANWFTVPIGLTVLVMAGLVRWIRRGRGGDPAGYDIVAVEFVGMSFLVGSALARTLGGHLWNGLLAIGIGVLVAAWGLMTQVRRRAAFGAASVVLAVVLLIGVPLSQAVTWRGPALWVTLSAIGIAAIAVASALESGRERFRRVARRLDQMTEGWERVSFQTNHDQIEAEGAGVDERDEQRQDTSEAGEPPRPAAPSAV